MANILSANASLSRGFDFGPRGGPFVPVFRFPSNEGNGAPGGAGSLAIGSLRPALRSASLCVVRRRTGPCEGSCASRRSIADRIVGGRTLLRHLVSRSTTPSIKQRHAVSTGSKAQVQ